MVKTGLTFSWLYCCLLSSLSLATSFSSVSRQHNSLSLRSFLPTRTTATTPITTPITRRGTTQRTTLLFASSKRASSASERERRDEEKRRQERANDVVIGKTSAKAGESDYALDIAATEREYIRQMSRVEQEIYKQIEKGMHHLKMMQVEEADSCFSKVFELKPAAYLWQAGICKFYLSQKKKQNKAALQDAAQIFVQSAMHFESRFEMPATEERIWRSACELKALSSITSKQERKRVEKEGILALNIKQIPLRLIDISDGSNGTNGNKMTTEEQAFLNSESRKVLKIARQLFDASIQKDHIGTILSRAKLRSISGQYSFINNDEDDIFRPVLDKKMWKLNAWFYLGLHYDAVGDAEESKKCMKMALRLISSSSGAVDIVHALPMLHMARRDWFDDDGDFDADLFDDDRNFNDNDDDNNFDDQDEDSESDHSTMMTMTATPTTTSSSNTIATNEKRSWELFASSSSSPLSSLHPDVNPIVVEAIKNGIEDLSVAELREALAFRSFKIVGCKEELRLRLYVSLIQDAGLI